MPEALNGLTQENPFPMDISWKLGPQGFCFQIPEIYSLDHYLWPHCLCTGMAEDPLYHSYLCCSVFHADQ